MKIMNYKRVYTLIKVNLAGLLGSLKPQAYLGSSTIFSLSMEFTSILKAPKSSITFPVMV
jgi:hypothetical protein